MAQHTESTLHIAAAPGTVADVVADVESYPEWTPQMRSVRVLTLDEAEWPREVEFVVDAGPIGDTYVLDYTWDLDEDGQGRVSWTLVRAGKLTAMDGSYTLVADGVGTTVTYALTVETTLSLPGVILRKAEKGIVAAALDGLKKRVEG